MKDRIRELRKQKKLSQAAFGEKLGVSRDVINNIELGRVEPKEILIRHLCEAFHLNDQWLRTGEGEMYTANTEKELFTEMLADALKNDNEDVRELIMSIFALKDDELKVVKDMVEIMKKKQPQE